MSGRPRRLPRPEPPPATVPGVASGDAKLAVDDPRYVRALAHPLRIRILAMLEERPASPVQLAPRLGSTLGRVGHHVRVLRDLGLIELVETRRRRGATEHIYSAAPVPAFSDEAWQRAGAAVRRRTSGALLGQIGEYVAGSAAAGGFDRPNANLSRVPLRLDEEGWEELASASKRWLAEAEAIQARTVERTRGEPPLAAGLVLLVFEAQGFSDRAG